MTPYQLKLSFREHAPLYICVIYGLTGCLWLLFSDRLAMALIQDHKTLSIVVVLKDWIFVLITALMLYYLINRVQMILKSHRKLLKNLETIKYTHKERNQQLVERYRLLSEYTSDLVLFTHEDGHILEANQAAVEKYGYTREELLERYLKELQQDRERDHYMQLRLFEEPRQDILYEAIHRRKDGSSFPVEISAQSGMLQGEKIFVYILRDITERVQEQAAFRANEERYRQLFSHMTNAVLIYEALDEGQDFILKDINQAGEIIDRLSRYDVIGDRLTNIFPSVQEYGILDIFRRVWLTGIPEHSPLTFYQDKRISIWRSNSVYKLPSGEIVSVYEDVTARKKAEEEVWQQKEKAQVTLQSIGDAVITTDTEGVIDYLNPVAEDLTGWKLSEAKGQPLSNVFQIRNEETGQLAEDPVSLCLREGRVVGLANHTVLIHRDGHPFAIEDSAAPILNRKEQIIGAVLVFHDVSEKRNLLHQMTHQAHHDSLTDLPNRLLFNDRLKQALAQARRNRQMVGVLFLDIDRFKLINDTLGHAMGDLLLNATSERLSSCLREEDTIARQGGDEFIIILPELLNAEDAALVARKILGVFAQPFVLEQHEVFITSSIGISLYPADGENTDTLIKHADTAMYHAKEQGRNNYQFFTDDLNSSVSERLSLENDMRKALERNEFLVYYQPQVNLSNGNIIGMEALVRWNHPVKGIISPHQFIPIAEDTGIIVPLGEWVLRQACQQNQLWINQGYPPQRVAVNLSARQFRQPNLVANITNILEETGMNPELLELEITESIAMGNADLSVNILNKLKSMSIRIAIDDFGTGFSSLSYLKRFPITTLKIDQTFVADIIPDTDGKEIVAVIIMLARNLGLNVIAEGVETMEQLVYLQEHNCEEIQGYLFSKPLPESEFSKLLAQKKRLMGEGLLLK